MKKILLVISLLTTSIMSVMAQSATIKVETAGTLSILLTNPMSIKELTLTGNLNGTDFRLIRAMAGNDYLGQPTNGVLKKLDISGANIVEGGEKYLDTDRVTSSTGTYTHMGGDFFHYNTQNNVIGNSLFAGCDKLEEIVLPNSITSIGDYVFWYCLNLKSLEIPKNVSSIGWKFIFGPNKISKLSVAAGNQSYSSPEGSNVLMQGTKLICGISSSKIPAGTTIIGSNAFADCSGLGDITLPEGVTTIEVGAFAWTDLTSIKLPSTLTTIENDAFAGCYRLTSFTLPKSVVSYGSGSEGGLGALKDCNNLTSIKVENGNSKYDSRNNCNAIIETATNTLISGCQNTVIPNNVTIIGNQGFRGIRLSDFEIPNWVTTLGERAFWNSNFSSIKIPASVTQIGEYAFAYCNNLTLIVEHTTPLEISENVFQNVQNSTLRVPAGCKAAYSSATGWNKFDNIVEENKVSKNVATAGTLSQLISDSEKFTITELILTGNLNGTDFRLLREMAGSDYQGHSTNGQLMKLDISGARIVAGGDKYFDSNGLYDENGNMQYGFGNYSVTTKDNVIGDCLFVGCSKLEEIKIPANIIEIGQYAFMCTNISSLDIPETVEKVALSLFNSTKVSAMYIPQNVNTLTAFGGFTGNSALSSIAVDANNLKYDSRNNCNAIIEKESNTLILGCKNSIIPDGVTSIGKSAFSYCYDLKSITIPTSVTSLQASAFFAAGLTSINLPSTLKRMEFNALAYTQISSITIPASVEYIGQSALRACYNLTQITVESGNTTYDSRDNCNAIIEKATNTLIQGCNTTTIPASVTAIGSQAFQECHNLASITIPASVSTIENYAFSSCSNLKDIYSYVQTPFAISTDVFWNNVSMTLHVPAGTKAHYLAAEGWKDAFSEENIIEDIEKEELVLNKTKLIIAKGESEVLTVTCPSSWTDKSVTWKSSNTKIATVTSKGKVKAVKTGTVTITCTSVATGAKATCEITVGKVNLDKSEASILKGTTMTLTPTVYPTSLEDKSVTWKSSNTKVATVSSSGKVTGVKTGVVTITCTSKATGLSATCKVTVGKVNLDKTEVAVLKGSSLTLTPTVYPATLDDKTVAWKSSNTKVATVSSAGEVKGVKAGTATITCTSNATGLKATCTVSVVNGFVTLNKTEACVQKGKTVTLKATVTPESLEDKSVTWESSNTKIATVSSSGKVKGVKYGTATITCTSVATGAKATCQVTVGKVVVSISEVSIKKSRGITLEATVYPSDLADKSVTWKSSDTSIATVTSEGRVKGIKAGTATITCTSVATGLKGTCTVTVLSVAEARSVFGEDDGTTAIENLDESPAAVEPYDVYDLSGRMVLHQVTSLDGLPNGIYIVNGRKVLKKD